MLNMINSTGIAYNREEAAKREHSRCGMYLGRLGITLSSLFVSVSGRQIEANIFNFRDSKQVTRSVCFKRRVVRSPQWNVLRSRLEVLRIGCRFYFST